MESYAPCYSDLGKKAKDLFSKDFRTGICNFDFKTKTCSGADIKISGKHDLTGNAFDSTYEFKTKITCGVLSKIKIDSRWNISDELEISDRIVRNLKQTAIASLRLDDSMKGFTLKNCHNSKTHNLELDFYFRETCPTTVGSMVIGPLRPSIPIYLGGTFTMEPRIPKPTKFEGILFHRYKDMHLSASINKDHKMKFTAFNATSLADVGFSVAYDIVEKKIGSGFAFLYKPSSGTFIKGKIDNEVQVGLAYGVKVSDGMNLVISSEIDGRKPQGEHKFGFTIEAVA